MNPFHLHRRVRIVAAAAALLAAASAWGAEMVDAKVRKVDREAAKMTLKHGEIKSLDMPPMTMVFHVRDKAMLERFKAGDKVRFSAVNDAGKVTIVAIEPAP
jgi:Cu/Ag efflux protein CusF